MKFLTFLTLAVQIFFVNFIYSQDTTYDAKGFENIPLQKESILSDKYPVILDDKALFYINSSLGPFSSKERAEAISKRLVDLKNNFFPDKLIVIRGETSLDIVYENRVIISITDKDAENSNLSKEEIVESYKNIILQTIIPETNYTIINNPKDIYNIFVENKSLFINIGKSLSITIIALIFILCITFGLKKINSLVKSKLFVKLKSIEVNGKIIISKVQILSIFNVIYFVVKYGAIIATLYSYYYVIGFVFPSVKNSFLFDFVKGLLLSGITVIVSAFIIKSFYNGINLIDKSLEKWRGNIIKSLKIKNINILSENQAVKLIKSVLFILKIGVISILLYITIPIIFSYFKFTSNWANVLL
nr:hypothetical protein [Spirochaetota bacterium]